jgi:hypothetical protein
LVSNKLKKEFVLLTYTVAPTTERFESLGRDTLFHGYTERRALELENVTEPENLFFIGVRSIEPQELEFLRVRCEKDCDGVLGACAQKPIRVIPIPSSNE